MNDWLTAAAMLLSGLVVGFMMFYANKRSTARSGDAERRDLQAKLDARVQQLRELDDVGGSADERARLEQEAAEALRELERVAGPVTLSREDGEASRDAQTPAGAKTSARPSAPPSAMKGFLWGAGSVAAIAALVFFVTSSAKQRDANEGMTGGQPAGAAPMQQAPAPSATNDAAIAQLEAAVKATPDDLRQRDDLAKAYLDRENFLGVVDQTRYVLQKSPDDARALTYEALVRVAMGQSAPALTMLERSSKSDPSLLETWVALAWIHTQNGNTAAAEAAMQQALTRHPEEKVKLTEVFAKMKAGPSAQPSEPTQSAAAMPPTGGPSGPAVHVTISVADASHISPNAVLFVFARAAGVTSGPPAAVKRLPASGFPLQLDLSAADSMMGQPLPPSMRIEARIDSDGVATTKDASDVSANADNVAAGANVTLTLK
jgi:cytochrome c-type biogenesis protein CcmH